jgi:hypothetical protein
MELNCRMLDYESNGRRDGYYQNQKESTNGLILYAEKSYEHVELLRLEESGIHIAEYLTDLPPRHVLEAKLHEAIRLAREQIGVRDMFSKEELI